MRSVLRILDANANRAREAIRVMEEAARFLLDDTTLMADLKTLRHDVSQAMTRLDDLEFHRDTPGDVGTEISTTTEVERKSIDDVAAAAGKRLSEALRTIEEYGKVIDPGLAGIIERLRYTGYDVEKRLNGLLTARARRVQWRLCLIVEGSQADMVPRVLDSGVDCVQIRDKSADAGAMLAAAERIREMTDGRAAFIVNDRPDIAMLAGADGVHLGQTDLPCDRVRRMVGPRILIGVSTARIDEAKQAFEDGADYCGVGPMFQSSTKEKDVIVGTEYLREYLEWNRLPHLAIGGVDAENVGELVKVGCRGVAVSSAICRATDPGAVAKKIRAAIESPHRIKEPLSSCS